MVIIVANFFKLPKIKWFISIRWKLFFSYILIGFVPLFFSYKTISVSMEDYFRVDKEKKHQQNANILADSISQYNYLFDESKRILFDNEIESKSRAGEYRILVLDSRGIVINDSAMTYIGKTMIIPEVIEAFEKKNAVKLRKDEQAVYAASLIETETKKKAGVVLIIAPASEIYVAIGEIEQKLVLFVILTIVLLIILVLLISQLFIDPLKNTLKVIMRMTEGYLNARVSITSHDEFAQLGDAFNNMSEKLEKVEKTREEFVSNVSHELKTPLSSIKVLTEAILLQENTPTEMYKEFLADINSEIDRMTNIVNDLLALVRLNESENSLNIQPTDLNKMVEEILKRLHPLAEHKDIEMLYEDMKKVTIEADEMKLSLALSNIVENAIKYTKQNGTVKVIVDADHQNAFITVSDTGIGISEAEQSKIFVRFYRVDKTRDRETGGTGLGLSITQKTVLMHNGSIRVSSKEGEGSTFVVRLPLKMLGEVRIEKKA